jgi:hypothetical protein
LEFQLWFHWNDLKPPKTFQSVFRTMVRVLAWLL